MLKYMLDTNICIYTIKNRPPEVREIFGRNQGLMCISTVTLMELFFGTEKSAFPQKNLAIVEGFAARLEVLDYNKSAAAHSGQLRAELAAAGTPIGPFDTMIAGHARSLGLILVSNNLREFGRVPGLRFEDWLLAEQSRTEQNWPEPPR
jgi:tRNA(fMet)-specific endonuclease VapC